MSAGGTCKAYQSRASSRQEGGFHRAISSASSHSVCGNLQVPWADTLLAEAGFASMGELEFEKAVVRSPSRLAGQNQAEALSGISSLCHCTQLCPFNLTLSTPGCAFSLGLLAAVQGPRAGRGLPVHPGRRWAVPLARASQALLVREARTPQGDPLIAFSSPDSLLLLTIPHLTSSYPLARRSAGTCTRPPATSLRSSAACSLPAGLRLAGHRRRLRVRTAAHTSTVSLQHSGWGCEVVSFIHR